MQRYIVHTVFHYNITTVKRKPWKKKKNIDASGFHISHKANRCDTMVCVAPWKNVFVFSCVSTGKWIYIKYAVA